MKTSDKRRLRPATKTPRRCRSNELGTRLRNLRLERGLERAELAAKANVPEARIARLETRSGAAAGQMTIFRFSSALGVRPEWLQSGRGRRAPDAIEKRLIRLYAEMDIIRDEQLARAIKRSKRRYRRSIVVVANSFAQKGERHTADGWIARLDEISRKLSPLLNQNGIWKKRARR